jgi:hypothetical protein
VVQWLRPDIQGGARAIFGTGGSQRGRGVDQAPAVVEQVIQTIADTEPVLVNVRDTTQDLIKTDVDYEKQLARKVQVIPKALETLSAADAKALQTLTAAETRHAATAIVTSKAFMKEIHDTLFSAQSMMSTLGALIPQVAGAAGLPQQQVGKKRSLFSKILGIAAPFLSFLPGGAILSTIAGAASSAVGGDWMGAATAAAGGFTRWGAHREAQAEAAHQATEDAKAARERLGLTGIPIPRAYGGPVYAGRSYMVGEYGRETFTPGSDGYITPGGGGEMLAAVAELRAAVQHLNTMPANQVVMRGARGLVRAMDHDAGLIRLTSQRMRLA